MRYYEKEIINELVEELKSEGLKVYVAERGTHGCFTDESGDTIVSFECDLGSVKFSGNYNSQTDGTGWVMDGKTSTESYRDLLNMKAPHWAVSNRPYTMRTAEDYLARYQESSNFKEV